MARSNQQFFDAMDNLNGNIEDLDSILLAIAGQLVSELKAGAPVDEGDLQRSIYATVANDTIIMGMLNYGAFTNFGVKGTEDSLGIPVPDMVLPSPLSGDTYKFKKRKFGIRDFETRYNRVWWNAASLQDRVYNEITNRITDI